MTKHTTRDSNNSHKTWYEQNKTFMNTFRNRIIVALLSTPLYFSCTPKQEPCYFEYIPSTTLSSINIIDRNGISETVSSKDRLKKYEEVDWLAPQPYEKV